MDNDFRGQTVIITGAGNGIGQALAMGFVGDGAHVVAIARTPEGLARTAELAARGTGSIETHAIDVTDAAALESLFRAVVDRRTGVDVLINGAAVYPRVPLADLSPQDWSAAVATNLNGVAFACRAAVKTFPAGRPAVVLNVGSFAHRGPEPASELYCATKAGVHALSRALAVELASRGSLIVVNEWVPGVFKTRMSGFVGEEPQAAFGYVRDVIRLSKQGPGGRLFLGGIEMLPARSLKQRIKDKLLGRR